MKKQNIYNCLMIMVLIIFCALTIFQLLNHIPWYDEIHAWDTAKSMTLSNVLSKLSIEGHFIIWYLFLMPFAKLNLWYPYPLKLLNWLFYFIAIVLMWKKAQFHWVFKTIITFSWLSLFYFPIVARCYSIGILGLVILACLYDRKIKHPVLYSSILVLTAHTSLVAALAVVPLAVIFLYEIFKTGEWKSKKDFIYPIIILLIGAVLWVMPFINGCGTPEIFSENPPSYNVEWLFFKAYNYTLGISYILCLLLLIYSADNKIRFFLCATFIEFMAFFGLVYCAYSQHIAMLYIFLVIGFWLTPKLHKWNVVTCIFLVIFACLSNFSLYKFFYNMLNNSDKTQIAYYINSQNPDYVATPWQFSDFTPVLNDDINVIIMNSYHENEKKKAKDMDDYVLNFLIKNDEHWSTIVVSAEKLNENSEKIDCPKKNKIQTLYLTKYSK